MWEHHSDVYIGAVWLFFCHLGVTVGWGQQAHQQPEQARRNKCFFELEGYLHRSARWLPGPWRRDCHLFCKYTVQLHPLVLGVILSEDKSKLYTVAVCRAQSTAAMAPLIMPWSHPVRPPVPRCEKRRRPSLSGSHWHPDTLWGATGQPIWHSRNVLGAELHTDYWKRQKPTQKNNPHVLFIPWSSFGQFTFVIKPKLQK